MKFVYSRDVQSAVDMLHIAAILVVLRAGLSTAATSEMGDDTQLNMYPTSQKVLEGQPAVFTCVSSRPFTAVVWKKLPKYREVDPERDGLSVTELSNSVSVLRIDETDPKKHRRDFECEVYLADVTGRISKLAVEASLKVYRRSARVQTYFPRITSSTKRISMMAGKRAAVLVCSSAADETQERPRWRWIKDNNVDVVIRNQTSQNSKGKLFLSNGGSKLTINDFDSADAGSYTCVASNRRGTAYSLPIELDDTGEVVATCTDRDGKTIQEGGDFHPSDDTCVICTCMMGTARGCLSAGCSTPSPDAQCAEYRFVQSRDKCCNFECKTPITKELSHTCRDRDGHEIAEGENYLPDEDPCVTCTCRQGAFGSCMSFGCETPHADRECDEYEFVASRDQCCNFVCKRQRNALDSTNTCTDRDGKAVNHGESFKPGADPCVSCTCWNGRDIACVTTTCSPPSRDVLCDHYVATLSSNTCCNFTCTRPRRLDIGSISVSSSTCTDQDGNTVKHGENYKPRSDPCVTCTCWKGHHIGCVSVACAPPSRDETCDLYQAVGSRDTCCTFMCIRPRPAKLSGSVVTTDVATDFPLLCRDRQNSTVRNGEMFHPDADPCVACRCAKGHPRLCYTIACHEPECEHYESVPDMCCEFVCHEPTTTELQALDAEVYIQQVGANSAIIQWEVDNNDRLWHPEGTISIFWQSTNSTWKTVYTGLNKGSVMVNDLDTNVVYHIKVTGNVDGQTAFASGQESFSLDGRIGNMLYLGHAREDILQAKSLYPNDFEQLADTHDMYISLGSFHVIQTTVEQARDCPNDECGILKFYMYKDDGYRSHYFSLMFSDIKDFNWAKAHL